MTRLEELRNLVADAFKGSEDKEMISKGAVVLNKLNEVEAERAEENKKYTELLSDYKDVVLHSAGTTQNVPGGTEPHPWDGNAEFNKLFS